MSDSPSATLHSAFYRFTPLADPVVAAEGINGTVAAGPASIAGFEAALQGPDVLAGALRGIAFHHSDCTTAPFGRLKVGIKAEIVALGLPDALPAPDKRDASHVAPAVWRELPRRDNVVVLDNRNHFEVRLGRFAGALEPGSRHFRDFDHRSFNYPQRRPGEG